MAMEEALGVNRLNLHLGRLRLIRPPVEGRGVTASLGHWLPPRALR